MRRRVEKLPLPQKSPEVVDWSNCPLAAFYQASAKRVMDTPRRAAGDRLWRKR